MTFFKEQFIEDLFESLDSKMLRKLFEIALKKNHLETIQKIAFHPNTKNDSELAKDAFIYYLLEKEDSYKMDNFFDAAEYLQNNFKNDVAKEVLLSVAKKALDRGRTSLTTTAILTLKDITKQDLNEILSELENRVSNSDSSLFYKILRAKDSELLEIYLENKSDLNFDDKKIKELVEKDEEVRRVFINTIINSKKFPNQEIFIKSFSSLFDRLPLDSIKDLVEKLKKAGICLDIKVQVRPKKRKCR